MAQPQSGRARHPSQWPPDRCHALVTQQTISSLPCSTWLCSGGRDRGQEGTGQALPSARSTMGRQRSWGGHREASVHRSPRGGGWSWLQVRHNRASQQAHAAVQVAGGTAGGRGNVTGRAVWQVASRTDVETVGRANSKSGVLLWAPSPLTFCECRAATPRVHSPVPRDHSGMF